MPKLSQRDKTEIIDATGQSAAIPCDGFAGMFLQIEHVSAFTGSVRPQVKLQSMDTYTNADWASAGDLATLLAAAETDPLDGAGYYIWLRGADFVRFDVTHSGGSIRVHYKLNSSGF